MDKLKFYGKSIAVLIFLLFGALVSTLFIFLVSLFNIFGGKSEQRTPSQRTIMLTGGKMTKCLQLARMFKSLGDRVIVVETPKYRFCGTRFSKAADKFIIIPDITGDGSAYQQALINIAAKENVDLFVPVASPKAALFDAMAKPDFPEHTRVFHFDYDIVSQLDDKHSFMALSDKFGLTVPESHLIDSKEQLLGMDFSDGKEYVLKKIKYDPVYRLDLRTIPHPGWEERVASLPIGKEDTWVLQEFIQGREICTHTTTDKGQMNLYICCDSSPFQVNYKMIELPEVRKWVTSFVKQLNATGQISFDFMVRDNGEVVPIECNPRTHSAITVFHDWPEAAKAYYDDSADSITYLPREGSPPTHWLYHELYRLVTASSWARFRYLLKRLVAGTDAIFDRHDPLPFLFSNHISIGYQILKALGKGQNWTHIDFNIGKLAIQGGD